MTALKTLFIITVSTVRLVFPGTPAAIGLPETAKPPAVQSLGLEILSDAEAGAGAHVTVDVPDGLKTTSPVNLQIDNAALKAPASTNDAKNRMVRYWGIGSEITGDQPSVTTVGEVQATITATAEKLPDKSYAYWPSEDAKPLSKTADLAGTYTLKTDCCGGTSVTLAKEQDFLDPIDITAPTSDPDLNKPIVVRWKPVANAAGYILKAYGGSEKQTITWTSATQPELAEGIDYRPLSKKDVDNYIKLGVLIPSYVATCTIPAKVFKDADSVMLVMTAVGKDITQTKDGIETRVIVRSTASAPLHSAPVKLLVPPKSDKEEQDSE